MLIRQCYTLKNNLSLVVPHLCYGILNVSTLDVRGSYNYGTCLIAFDNIVVTFRANWKHLRNVTRNRLDVIPICSLHIFRAVLIPQDSIRLRSFVMLFAT